MRNCCYDEWGAIGPWRSEQRGAARGSEAGLLMAFPAQGKTGKPPAELQFTPRDIRDAARLLELISRLGDSQLEDDLDTPPMHPSQPNQTFDREVLLTRAKKQYRDRELRKQFFNPVTFGETAWDILLVLYIGEFSGRHITVRRLADRINAPLSTTQRWLAYLERERLVRKEGPREDKRLIYIRLIDRGHELLDNYFAALSQ